MNTDASVDLPVQGSDADMVIIMAHGEVLWRTMTGAGNVREGVGDGITRVKLLVDHRSHTERVSIGGATGDGSWEVRPRLRSRMKQEAECWVAHF